MFLTTPTDLKFDIILIFLCHFSREKNKIVVRNFHSEIFGGDIPEACEVEQRDLLLSEVRPLCFFENDKYPVWQNDFFHNRRHFPKIVSFFFDALLPNFSSDPKFLMSNSNWVLRNIVVPLHKHKSTLTRGNFFWKSSFTLFWKNMCFFVKKMNQRLKQSWAVVAITS